VTAAARVWAPGHQVECVVGGARRPLDGEAGGWQAGPGPQDGERYAFALDGGEPLPDPRSPSQPDGVHGASAAVDHEAFAWTDAGWRGVPFAEALIYELHVGAFTPEGTFEAAIARLDHLVDLGVTAVELMPVAEFAGDRGWGYDGVDLYAPHHAYGGPEGLWRLVDACHGRGLAVLMDVVFNHLGPEGNYLARFGPYFTDHYSTPWGPALNYDQRGSDEVRAFVLDCVEHWVRDYHCDGVRLDAVHAIFDMSATHLLEAIADRARALQAELGREVWVIAESDLNDPRLVQPVARGGYGLTASWSDDFHHALHALLTGERAGYYADFGSGDDLCRALREGYVYAGRYSAYRDRTHGRPLADVALSRLLGYSQNHDQVGNRALGDRSAALLSPGRLRAAAALVLLSPFTPLLFMGEEWGAGSPFPYFTDLRDPGLGTAVSEGRRREFAAFGWDPATVPDPQDPAVFAAARLDWDEPGRAPHREVLGWYRALIALRRHHLALAGLRPGEVEAGWDETDRILTYRAAGLLVCVNLGATPCPPPAASGGAPAALAWGLDGDGIAPDGVALWEL